MQFKYFSYVLNLFDNGCTITGCFGSDTSVVIPSEIKGHPVTAIDDMVFVLGYRLTDITFPDSLTRIGEAAFMLDNLLNNVAIHEGLTDIGKMAFAGCGTVNVDENNPNYKSIDGALYSKDGETLIHYPCTAQGTVEIPGSVKIIAEGAFVACTQVDKIVIPDGVTNIGDYAFAYCSNLSEVTIPSSVTDFGSNIFENCAENLTLTVVEDSAAHLYALNNGIPCNPIFEYTESPETDFAYNTIDGSSCEITGYTGSDANIIIPSEIAGYTVKRIAGSAFQDNQVIRRIVLPSTLEYIGGYAFCNCNSLIEITIPSGVTGIGNNTFHCCQALKTVIFEDNSQLKNIGDFAFYFCGELSEITLPANVERIGSNAFMCCVGLNRLTIPAKVESIGSNAFAWIDTLTSVTFEENAQLKYIENNAFELCTNLTEITLPASVESIGDLAFNGCGKINVDANNMHYKSIDDVLYDKSGEMLIHCPVSVEGTLDVPEGVKCIDNSACFRCNGLTEVVLSDGLESISVGAFAECGGLVKVTIPNGVKSIDDAAFKQCNSLTEVIIPGSVTNIGSEAFYNCMGLSAVMISEGVERIGSDAFAKCYNFTRIFLPESLTSIGEGAFNDCYALEHIYYCGTETQWEQLENRPSGTVHYNSKLPESIVSNTTETTINIGVPTSLDHPTILPEGDATINEIIWTSSDDSIVEVDQNGVIIGRKLGEATITMKTVNGLTATCTVTVEAPTIVKGNNNITLTGDESYYVFIPKETAVYSIYTTGSCDTVGSLYDSNLSLITTNDDAEDVNFLITHELTAEQVYYIGARLWENGTADVDLVIEKYCDHQFEWKQVDDQYVHQCSLCEKVDMTVPILVCGEHQIDLTNTETYFAFIPQTTDTYSFYLSDPTNNNSIAFTAYDENMDYLASWENYVNIQIPRRLEKDKVYIFGAGLPWNDGSQIPVSLKIEENNNACFIISAYEDGISIDSYIGDESNVVIPDYINGIPVKSIGDAAFFGCNNLTEITIPSGVTNIGSSAFAGCGVVNVESDNQNYKSVNGVLYDKSGETLIHCPTTESGFNIPQGVKRIDSGAFSFCGLIGVTIPEGVTSIGDGAFYECINLTEVTIPEGVSSIDEYAFYGCSGLKDMTIPVSVTDFGSNIFGNSAEDLTLTVVEGSAAYLYALNNGILCNPIFEYTESPETDFSYNTVDSDSCEITGYTGSDANIIIPSTLNGYTVKGIADSAFRDNQVIRRVVLPSTLEYIADFAFYYCNSLTEVTIPSGVTSIGSWAFAQCDLVNIEIPQSVINIGENAFVRCDKINVDEANLKYKSDNGVLYDKSGETLIHCPVSVEGVFTVPEGVKRIGRSAFEGCGQLTEVSIPSSVTSIDEAAFSSCALTTVSFDENSHLKNICAGAFSYCNSLESIDIPDGVLSIGDASFTDCDSLQNIRIPDSVISIGENAFIQCGTVNVDENNPNYKSVDGILYDKSGETLIHCPTSYEGELAVPESVTRIADYAFAMCSGLTEVMIPSDVTNIGYSVFENCGSLKTVIFEENSQLKQIGTSAFNSCGKLTEVTIPDGVESIGDYAFSNCKNLTEVTIPGSVDNIAYGAFSECSRLISVTISDGVTQIDSYAFAGCSALASCKCPASLTEIGWGVFENCPLLTLTVVKDSESHIYAQNNNIPFELTTESPVAALEYSIIDEGCVITGYTGDYADINIPAKLGGYPVTAIADGAFKDNTTVKHVVLPNSMVSIGASAFAGCTELIKVTIPGSVTDIDESAFAGCTDLIEITLPRGVACIGDQAFAGCTGMLSCTCPTSLVEIGTGVFDECTNVKLSVVEGSEAYNYAIANGLNYELRTESPEEYFQYYVQNEEGIGNCCVITGYNGIYTDVVVPAELGGFPVVEIEGNAFAYNTAIKRVVLPATVKRIETSAFYGCEALTAVIFEENSQLQMIGYSAFAYCRGLTEVTIPASVTNIGETAFIECESLKIVTFEEYSQLMDIGDYAFRQCNNLTEVVIPTSVTNIGSFAFSSCESLTTVTFEENSQLTGIGDYVFAWCHNLSDLTIPGGVTNVGAYAFANSGLSEITIPAGVINLADGAFAEFGAVNVDDNNPNYKSVDGVLYDKSGETLLHCPNSFEGTFRISENVKRIGCSAFSNCHGLIEVVIPDSVTDIDLFAFEDCNSLTAVTFGENSQLTRIGDQAFARCYNLTELMIPVNVTNIGNETFWDCDSLRSITIPIGVTNIKTAMFAGCDNLNNVVISKNVTNIEENAFEGCYNLKNIYYEGTVDDWDAINGDGKPSREDTTIHFDVQHHYHQYGWDLIDGNYVYQCSVCGDTDQNMPALTMGENSVTLTGEESYYAFIPEETAAYNIYTISDSDTYGYLYDSIRTQICYDDDSGENNNFQITQELTAGQVYCIGARLYSSGTADVNLVIEKYCDHQFEWKQVNGNGVLQCKLCDKVDMTVPMLQLGGNDVSLNRGEDTRFAFIPEETATYCISFMSDANVGLGYSIWDINWNDVPNNGNGYELTAGKGYCIGVIQYDAEMADVTIAIKKYCEHQYEWKLIDGNYVHKCSQCDDVDMTASSIQKGENEVSLTNNQSHYTFIPDETARYLIYTTGSSDTYGYLYDSDMSQINYNDNGGDNTNFLISAELTGEQVYCIGAGLFGPGTADVNLVIEKYCNHQYEWALSDNNYIHQCSLCGKVDMTVPVYNCEDYQIELTNSEEYFAFIPEKTGIYNFNLSGNDQMVFTAYNENKGYLAFWSGTDLRVSRRLTEGQIYIFGIRLFNLVDEESAVKVDLAIEENGSGYFGTMDYEDGLSIISYLGDNPDVTIPSEINGKKVLRIESLAGDVKVKSLTIPEGVTSIAESNSFSSNDWFSELETLNLPSTLSGKLTVMAPIKQLSVADNCTGIKEIRINSHNLESLTGFGGFSGVETMSLSSERLSDISAIKDLKTLKTLFITSTSLVNLSGIDQLTQLETLHLFSNMSENNNIPINELSKLSNLSNLKTLIINKNQNIQNLDFLIGCNALESLTVSMADNLTDISALKQLPNLKQVNFAYSGLSDISVLKELDQLTSVQLTGSNVSEADMLSLIRIRDDMTLDLGEQTDVIPVMQPTMTYGFSLLVDDPSIVEFSWRGDNGYIATAKAVGTTRVHLLYNTKDTGLAFNVKVVDKGLALGEAKADAHAEVTRAAGENPSDAVSKIAEKAHDDIQSAEDIETVERLRDEALIAIREQLATEEISKALAEAKIAAKAEIDAAVPENAPQSVINEANEAKANIDAAKKVELVLNEKRKGLEKIIKAKAKAAEELIIQQIPSAVEIKTSEESVVTLETLQQIAAVEELMKDEEQDISEEVKEQLKEIKEEVKEQLEAVKKAVKAEKQTAKITKSNDNEKESKVQLGKDTDWTIAVETATVGDTNKKEILTNHSIAEEKVLTSANIEITNVLDESQGVELGEGKKIKLSFTIKGLSSISRKIEILHKTDSGEIETFTEDNADPDYRLVRVGDVVTIEVDSCSPFLVYETEEDKIGYNKDKEEAIAALQNEVNEKSSEEAQAIVENAIEQLQAADDTDIVKAKADALEAVQTQITTDNSLINVQQAAKEEVDKLIDNNASDGVKAVAAKVKKSIDSAKDAAAVNAAKEAGINVIEEIKSIAYGKTLNLEDSIEIILYIDGQISDSNKYQVKATYKGVSTYADLSNAPLTDKGYRFVIADCAAKEMFEKVHVVVTYDGINIKEFDYSVYTYCHNQIFNSSNEDLKELCRSALDYGTYARTFFGYEEINPVEFTYNVRGVSGVNVIGESAFKSGQCTGIQSVSATLSLESRTKIIFYLTPVDGAISDNYTYTFCGGDFSNIPLTATTNSDGRIRIEASGIAAAKLGEMYTLTVTNVGTEGSMEIHYSPMIYAKNMQSSEVSNLSNLVKSLYRYYDAAKNYFSDQE